MAPETPKKRTTGFTERRLQEQGGVERRRANFGLSRAYSARPVAACRLFATAIFMFTDGSMATIETRIMSELNEASALLICHLAL